MQASDEDKQPTSAQLDLTRQLDHQADILLSSAYQAPSHNSISIPMIAASDHRLLHLSSSLPLFSNASLPLSIHQGPSFSIVQPQHHISWPLSYPPLGSQYQQQQVFHPGAQVHNIQPGGFPYPTSLSEQGGQQVGGSLESHDDMSLELTTKKAARGKNAATTKSGKQKHSATQGSRRITPRLSELLTLSSVPAQPAQTLGKRPSQYIQDLQVKVSKLRMRKTEVDVRVSMLEDENSSLNRQYQQLIDIFGAGRLAGLSQPSLNIMQGGRYQ